MDAYYNVHIIPCGAKITSNVMGALLTRVHKLFDKLSVTDIGISFPAAGERSHTLGHVLRLHGSRKVLQNFIDRKPFAALDYMLRLGEVEDVPEQVEWRVVRRVQCRKSNVERVRRRHARRHNLTMEEARKRIRSSIETRLDVPCVMVHGPSTHDYYPLFIDQCPVEEPGTGSGSFSTFGLSQERAVPWF